MMSEPLPSECAEIRQRLADSAAGGELLDHLAGCQGCAAFSSALAEVQARLALLPLPEPPAGAADRAIARFRAEFAADGSPATTPLAPSSTASPVRAAQARRRRWRSPVSLAAGVAAAIVLVVALVAVLGPTGAPPAYAAILHEAAVHTGAEKSARFDLTGAIGLSVSGQNVTTALTGTGATQFPDRGELTEVGTILGKPLLTQDIVSVGNKVWTRSSSGQWVLVPIPPDHASPIDQALEYPAQALDDIARVGSGYRSLGVTTVDGTRVRQIELTIPGDSFHAFGSLPERASRWTVVIDVSQSGLILRRLSITGHGSVSLLGSEVAFTYDLKLTLYDFGAKVSIQPPATGRSSR